MKKIASILAFAAVQLVAGAAFAQTVQTSGDGGSNGAEVTKPASAAEKAQARADRKVVGKQVARTGGDSIGDSYGVGAPNTLSKKVSKSDRAAARAARHAEVTKANKAGELKTYGDDRAPANAK